MSQPSSSEQEPVPESAHGGAIAANHGPVMRAMLAVDRALTPILKGILVAVGLVLSALMFTQIILRYVIQLPFLGIEETSVLLGFWLYFLGTAYITRQQTHITGGIADLVIKNPRVKLAIHFAGTIFCILTTMAFTYHGFNYFLFVLKTNRKSTYLAWPTWIWVSALLVGLVLTIFFFVLQAVRQWQTLQQKPAE